jgi:hypothetical protein
MYKILWIDDDLTANEAVLDEAHLHQIELIHFEYSKAGTEYLNKHLHEIDGVILDAKVKDLSSDELPSLKGLQRSVNHLSSLSRQIPYCIFTGQKDLQDNKTFDDIYFQVKIFRKGLDNEKMFAYLKEEADKQEFTQIRKDYKDVFDVLTDDYTHSECAELMMNILRGVRNPSAEFNDKLYFTEIRKILEWLFRNANKRGLLHDKCIVDGIVNLTESRSFMAGLPTRYNGVVCKKAHFNKIVAIHTRNILLITGAGSHTTDPELDKNINLTAYRTIIQTPYLLYSLAFQLMDTLLWYKKYADDNPNIEANKGLWSQVDIERWYEGTLGPKNQSGWADFISDDEATKVGIHPNNQDEAGIVPGDSLRITIKPYHVNKIEKL